MTAPLNQSLAVIWYKTFDGSTDAICFVGDLDQPVEEQATEYLRYENIDFSDFGAYWHNALEDIYGNRYEPKVQMIEAADPQLPESLGTDGSIAL